MKNHIVFFYNFNQLTSMNICTPWNKMSGKSSINHHQNCHNFTKSIELGLYRTKNWQVFAKGVDWQCLKVNWILSVNVFYQLWLVLKTLLAFKFHLHFSVQKISCCFCGKNKQTFRLMHTERPLTNNWGMCAQERTTRLGTLLQ